MVLNHTKMLSADVCGPASADIVLNIPIDGVYISFYQHKNVGQKRAAAIFALVARRELCEKDHLYQNVEL